MTIDTKELQRCIDVIENHLPQIYNNIYSKSVCLIILALAKKYRDELPNEKIEEGIPSNFINILDFCNEWHWCPNTVMGQLYRGKATANKTICRVDENKKGMKQWFVDEDNLLKFIAKKGQSTRTRNHAQRCIDMKGRMKDIEDREIGTNK